ncbi:hypothetical protein MHTCC0001_16380 [Flavobacteriaceae bacterium MHTCC 0001]
MTLAIIIPLLFLGALTIIVLSYVFGKRQILLRELSKLTPKEILQFRTNEPTKVTGKVLHVHEPFVAPFSKRKCVAYEFVIKQKKSTGKNSYWKTIVKEEDIQDFFVEHKGEVAMIKPTKNPKNYKNYFVADGKVSSGIFKNPTPEFKQLLEQYDIKSENFFGFNKALRYTERILEVGETVTVGGIAKWKTLNTTINGYNYSKIAALESTNEQKIVITDLPEASGKA